MKSSLVVLFLAFCPSAAKPNRADVLTPAKHAFAFAREHAAKKSGSCSWTRTCLVCGITTIPDGYAKDDIVEWGESLGYNLCKGEAKWTGSYSRNT